MRDSKYFEKLMDVMQQIAPERLDEQLLLYGGEKVKREIPFDTLLSQFKYCLNHGIKSEAYLELKALLGRICGTENIDAVEEQYNVGD